MLNRSNVSNDDLVFDPPISWNGLQANGGFGCDGGCSGTSGGPSFASAPFARWTAPYAGYVTVTGNAHRVLLQDPDPNQPINTDPVTASVYVHWKQSPGRAAKIWSYEFSPTEWQHCGAPNAFIPDDPGFVDTNCNNGPTLFYLGSGDDLFFYVESKQGIRRNAVEWNPIVAYVDLPECDTGSCVEPYATPGANLQPNVYYLQSDHRLAGTPPSPFVSSSADTLPNGSTPTQTYVNVTGRVRKVGITGDNVRFQILRRRASLTSVVWPTSGTPMELSSSATNVDLDMGPARIDVKGQWLPNGTFRGDELYAQVISDSPIDPRAIDWHPTVTYENFCRPDAAAQAADIRSRANRNGPVLPPDPALIPIQCGSAADFPALTQRSR